MWGCIRPVVAATAKGLLAGLVFPVAFCVTILVARSQVQVLRLLAPFAISCFLTSLLVSLALQMTSPKGAESIPRWRISSLGWVALGAITVAFSVLVLFLPEFGGKRGWLWFVLVPTTGVAGWVSAESIKRRRTSRCT
jgi:hypothetical protein